MISLSIFHLSEFGKFDPAGVGDALLRGSAADPVGKFDSCSRRGPDRAEFRERRAKHGGADRAPGRAVQPVVVRPLRLQFPFINPPAASLGLHPVFSGEVFREQLVDAGNPAVERETRFVPQRIREPGVNEALPLVRV